VPAAVVARFWLTAAAAARCSLLLAAADDDHANYTEKERQGVTYTSHGTFVWLCLFSCRCKMYAFMQLAYWEACCCFALLSHAYASYALEQPMHCTLFVTLFVVVWQLCDL